jgi:hypothetical protein
LVELPIGPDDETARVAIIKHAPRGHSSYSDQTGAVGRPASRKPPAPRRAKADQRS